MESLDRLFENVCELDLIFNFETLHAALAEMIVGGVVIETQVGSLYLQFGMEGNWTDLYSWIGLWKVSRPKEELQRDRSMNREKA